MITKYVVLIKIDTFFQLITVFKNMSKRSSDESRSDQFKRPTLTLYGVESGLLQPVMDKMDIDSATHYLDDPPSTPCDIVDGYISSIVSAWFSGIK